MAHVYKGSNHLSRSAWRSWCGGMLFVLLCAGYVYMLLAKQIPGVGWFEVLPAIFFAILAQCLFGRYAKYRAGLRGEIVGLKYAKKLPDNYYVFTNVVFGHAARRTEIDLVIIGEKGVFILEVKNHRGLIHGNAAKEEWTQYPKGRRGKSIRPMYNPLWQARRQAYHLAERLRHKNIGVWVESAVVFVNKAVTVEVTHLTRPILTSPREIRAFILENQYTQPLNQDMVEKIAEAVRSIQKEA